MSHTTTLKAEFTDRKRLKQACGNLKMGFSLHGKSLLDEANVAGVKINLSKYHSAVVLEDGSLQFDSDYTSTVNKLRQEYSRIAVEESLHNEFIPAGFDGEFVTMPDGTIQLNLQEVRL